MKPPDITSDPDRLFAVLLASSKADKYYKAKRNRAFKKICDFTHDYLQKFDPESSLSLETESIQPNPTLFASKKDRKINENNRTFQEIEIKDKARRAIREFSSRKEEIRRDPISKNLSNIINNDAWIPSCQSFQEGSSRMTLSSKPRTAPTCLTKPSYRRTRKTEEDSPLSSAQIPRKCLSKVLQPVILGFRSAQKPFGSYPLKPGAETSPETRLFNGDNEGIGRRKAIRSEHVNSGRVGFHRGSAVHRKPPGKNPLVEDFVKNYETIRNSVKPELLTRFLLKRIKPFKQLKRVFFERKELRKESFTRGFLYEILKSRTFFQSETPEGEAGVASKGKFIAELRNLNNELENLIIERHRQELSYVENSLINSYEEFKTKELSFELKREKKQVNYYKTTNFDQDIALIKQNLESKSNISKELASLERTFGECWQINSKEKKIMRSMDTLYKDLNRRFQCVKDKYENPYFVV